ncbi:MAG: TRAP transporter small permease subunit [Gammaproteobacteria bacterium]|nr:TRAP transporter small permease subunit [Gammaproteobacteria bacterium]
MKHNNNMFTRLAEAGRFAEDAVLVVILTGMILLAASQIVLRNFLDVGFIWGDELLRMLVLWIAVAGAVAASRTDKHINIAILDRFLPDKPAQAVKVLIHLFTAVVCGIVTWFSIQFVRTTHEFGDLLLGDVPAWWLQLVLPVGFGLISYRYLLFAITDFTGLFSNESKR